MSAWRGTTAALALVVACKEQPRETVSAPFGYLEDAKLEQLRTTCPTTATVSIVGDDRPDVAYLVYQCSWREPSELAWNSVTIHSRKKDLRIEEIALATTDRAAATRAFERFAGPILPTAARDELRRTLDHEDAHIQLEAKGGRLVKQDNGRGAIVWSFDAYVPSQ